MKSENYRLQFITHYKAEYSYIDSARIALEGGCRWVQLRMKDADETQMEEVAIIVQRMCREYGATFIIDDNVMLAKRVGADGVHLGKNDMPIAEARRLLGSDFIIGGTVNSFEDVVYHLKETVPDYFGCGPFRFTSTKKNLAPVLGCEGYRNIIRKMRDCNINIPIVAIGGINKTDIPEILGCEVDGIALSGSVINADNPKEEMQNIADMLKDFRKHK